MPLPVIQSLGDYIKFADESLAIVRRLRHLSGDDPHLAELDKRMSHCWRSSVCGRAPTAEDRAAAQFDRVTVDELRAPIAAQLRRLAEVLQELSQYFNSLPPVPGDTGLAQACGQALCHALNPQGAKFCRRCGSPMPPPLPKRAWQLPRHLVHPDAVIKKLSSAIHDARCLNELDPDDALYSALRDELVLMAKWTRESLHPGSDERASAQVGRFTAGELDAHLDTTLARAVESLHYFNELYVAFPYT